MNQSVMLGLGVSLSQGRSQRGRKDGAKWRHQPNNVDSARSRNFLEIFSGAEQGRFSLGWAEELAILQKPLKNIVDRAVTSHPSRELTAT